MHWWVLGTDSNRLLLGKSLSWVEMSCYCLAKELKGCVFRSFLRESRTGRGSWGWERTNNSEQGFECQQKRPRTCLKVPISVLAPVLLLDAPVRSQAAGHRSTEGKTDCSTSSWLLVVEWFLGKKRTPSPTPGSLPPTPVLLTFTISVLTSNKDILR